MWTFVEYGTQKGKGKGKGKTKVDAGTGAKKKPWVKCANPACWGGCPIHLLGDNTSCHKCGCIFLAPPGSRQKGGSVISNGPGAKANSSKGESKGRDGHDRDDVPPNRAPPASMGKKAIMDLLLGCAEIRNDPNQSDFVAQAMAISEDAKKPKPASAINQAQGNVSSTLRLQTEAGLKCTKVGC